MGKFVQDFKEFICKGNVIDMAVGVVVGGAFNKIVTSLVNDIIMPLVGCLVGNGIADWKLLLVEGKDAVEGVSEAVEAVYLNYGNFIQTGIDFLIIAFTIFVVLRIFTALQGKRKSEDK